MTEFTFGLQWRALRRGLTRIHQKLTLPGHRPGFDVLEQKGPEMPARLVSVINMKGGVGKSTTTVSLAETLALHQRRRVLVIDLDPQTNASIMVAGPGEVERAARSRAHARFLFRDPTSSSRRPSRSSS